MTNININITPLFIETTTCISVLQGAIESTVVYLLQIALRYFRPKNAFKSDSARSAIYALAMFVFSGPFYGDYSFRI